MDKFSELKVTIPADKKSRESVAAGYVTDNNSGGYFVIECQECGAVYPSQQADGGGQIADTGDYNDAICPHCGEEGPEECENVGLAWNVQQAKIIALLAELEAKDKRIAELKTIRADASQVFKEIGNELGCNPDNESIMMAIDAVKEREKRVVALAGGNADLWETMAARLEAAEARLATPVRLPKRYVISLYDDVDWEPHPNGDSYACEEVIVALREQGFTVVEDE
ncbi:hypothetical protein [Serratia liquefaciens]|uniref:hypothetical protein n=1 Tax=Serratia liquefaciens TaxID=614 RepID=UPI000DFFD688|nr:hypothetical protein [Serratia liquefaciens]SUI70759.1 Uncharacterised protein [Serratia liquefaciens]